MNTNYRILWIDDTEDYYESAVELIRDIVSENNMVPQIKYYEHYEDYEAEELAGFDAEIFNQYDQLIIDYALSGITGDSIIRNLRARGIYTDIVFYSSEFTKMQEELQKGTQLDGVFLADRNDLTSVVGNVIKKNLRREYNIANIRGLIMDNSSEFDYICRITAVDLFNALPPEKQGEIEAVARTYIEAAQKQSKHSFEEIGSKKGSSFVKKAMHSVDYVMSNKDRYSLMTLILKAFDFAHDFSSTLADEYDAEIIKPRNKLAHSMLFCGDCKKRLHIVKDRQDLKCNHDCTNCSSSYSIETCEALRKRLFEYYKLFHQIDERTATYLKSSQTK